MQKRLFIRIVATAVFFITTSAAWGAPVTPEQAFARLAGTNGPAGAKGCGPRMRLTHTFRTSDAPSAYVFAGTDGYLLAPADDLAPAVLGYMERFDPDNIPAAMQWWIDQYALTTEWPEPDADDGDHPAIPAMLTTKWGQWAPYNMLCPEDAGVRSVTGCVATALAQILNYHKWPQGTGTGSYSSSRNGYELKFDYGATTFDWSRLRDSYGEDATDAEREEVARLMLACGIGVDMKYSSSSSSASEVGVSRLLTDHLGYDMSAAYRVREYYTYREWDELIYGELAAGRPVLYCGVGDSWGDAHAFVCDGYKGDGFYHINWGWNGDSDGYFMLAALDPEWNSDINGYNNSQVAITGIRPSTGSDAEAFIPLYARGRMDWDHYAKKYLFGSPNLGTICNTAQQLDLLPGVSLEDKAGNTYYVGEYKPVRITGVDGRFVIKSISPHYTDDLPAGKYKVRPVVSLAGTGVWQPILTTPGDRKPLVLTKTEDGFVFHETLCPEYQYLWITERLESEMSPEILGFEMRGKTAPDGSRYYEGTVNIPQGTDRFMFMAPDGKYFGSATGFHELFGSCDTGMSGGLEEIDLSSQGLWIYLTPSWRGGEVTMRVSLEDMTASFAWQSPSQSGLQDVDAPQGTPTYYNLQGQPVANPGSGVYIRLTDGVAAKIRIP